MAIRIIKEGNKKEKFTVTCPDCKCVFEYELEDIVTDYSNSLLSYPAKYETYVRCPCCGKHIHHGYTEPDYPNKPNIIYCNHNTDLDCDKCINKPDPTKPIVGDTPCTWCKKNVPYCTATNTGEYK